MSERTALIADTHAAAQRPLALHIRMAKTTAKTARFVASFLIAVLGALV